MKSILQLTRRSGFTLIEVLVAVTISAIVLTIVYSSLFQVIKTKDRVEETNNLIHEVRVLFTRIEKDLSNAYARGKYTSVPSSDTYFLGTQDGNNSRLAFTAFTRDTTYKDNQTDQTEITYYLQVNEEKKERFYLLRRDNPYPGNDNAGFVYPISENVVNFQLFYADENSFEVVTGGEKTKISEWNSAEIGSLPNAVEVNITLRDDYGDERQFSSLFLIPASNN